MVTSGGGLRELKKQNPYFSGDPQLVVFSLDAATMRFTEVHGNPVGLIGFPAEHWLDRDFWPARIHPEDRGTALEFCMSCTNDRRGHELEYRALHADGRVLWVHEIVEFGDDDTDIASGYIMNITRRVQQEQDVHKMLGLKEALFRVVVEDLSQPVNKISSFGDMLERHLAMQGDDVGSDYAVGLREGLQELGEMISGLQGIEANSEVNFDELSDRLAALRERGPKFAKS